MADNNPAMTLEWRLVSNGGIVFGGWNLDDVRVFSRTAVPPPPVRYQLSPAQIALGAPSTVDIRGTAGAPIALLFSSDPGPTTIPGLPPLSVGSSFFAIGAVLDGSGQLSASFNAPNVPSATGVLTYSQVVELTNMTTLSASNAMVILFGQ